MTNIDFDFNSFVDACEPSKDLVLRDPVDRSYYIDFSPVRGGKIIDTIKRTITKLSQGRPTCQLFSGHIGCGKSTELRYLEAELMNEGFHVVYFESSQDLDMADVDLTDILLSITRQVSLSLMRHGISLQPQYFLRLFEDIKDFLNTPIDLTFDAEFSLPMGLGKITAQTKDSPKLRSRLRQFLEPQTNSLLKAINQEVLEAAQKQLLSLKKKGIVVIVDNLDRIDARPKTSERSQPEYIFVDRGEQLRKLNCHVVYTVPLSLIFSNEAQGLTNRLGRGVPPIILPMVPVNLKNGEDFHEGIELLRQVILARAFPKLNVQQRIKSITFLFDKPQTLDRLCKISGGHLRTLMGMLYRCLQEEDIPISRDCLERVIRQYRDMMSLAVTKDEWNLLKQVEKQQIVSGDKGYDILLRSMFVFEYQDQDSCWFGINPVLFETQDFNRS